MSRFTNEQCQQVFHLAQMSVLAMTARSFAATEFETEPGIAKVRISVLRTKSPELHCEVEFLSETGIALGAMVL